MWAVSSGDVGNDSLSARASAVAAVGEEKLRLAGRAMPVALYRRAPGFEQRSLRREAEVEVAAVHHPVAKPRAKRLGHLLAHLVAARPDPGADRRGDPVPRRRGDAFGGNAAQKTTPADVEDREPRRSGGASERDGKAVRGDEHERAARPVRPETVAALVRGSRSHDTARV